MEQDVTRLLSAARTGDRSAVDSLYRAVYAELHRLALSQMRREGRAPTLQPTALVNEAWLRLVDQRVDWQGRGHFFALAAQAMRRILVDHARRRCSNKRGGNQPAASVDDLEDVLPSPMPDERLLAMDEALTRLADIDPRQARVVELRFFAGLSVADTAAALDISPTTVKREWATARAWLFDAIAPGER